ncbi:winged helix-turn-helix domain-containing protein [Streptomyces sp. HUAS ZL42]|uniref:helix-turn-helix domain-containing protein n=1 Tax=Streptomyces sp. HUAS ZL42 TaxID=3231715 RepID=UPI00345ED3DC
MRTLIGRKFHLSYSVSGVTRLLHRMGYSVQMPARPAAEDYDWSHGWAGPITGGEDTLFRRCMCTWSSGRSTGPGCSTTRC